MVARAVAIFFTLQEHFARAKELAGMTFVLTGALGKRTKFQQQDTAQLLLQVTSDLNKAGVNETTSITPTLPKVCTYTCRDALPIIKILAVVP